MMNIDIMIREIAKFNPLQIHFFDNRIITWIDNNPVLIIDKMELISDTEIEELYINLKINFLVQQFGIEKCEKIFNEFSERRC